MNFVNWNRKQKRKEGEQKNLGELKGFSKNNRVLGWVKG